jgi:DNA-binding CsgD family transcriptional regulator
MKSLLGKPLSRRERQVARMVLDGRRYRGIAKMLRLSPLSIACTMHRVRAKVGVATNIAFAQSDAAKQLQEPASKP